MGKRWRLAVHDLHGKRLCTLFDTNIQQYGDAYSIKRTRGIDGWKELSFCLSRKTTDSKDNYRCEFVKAENMVYVYEDDECDVFCIKEPSDLHDNSKMQITVNCVHISAELKTKNLYTQFDDMNGIGRCDELITKAIAGTGWTLVACDTFFEADGETEKIRSYSCDAKTGAYNMISGICKLFNARPIFHGYTKQIEIRSIYSHLGWMEILFGKNSDKIQRITNSDNLITRLYVEGEYGDFGYVGIDSVNPTGLPFILNFDYYKELGLFTATHQAAVNTYLADYKTVSDTISLQTEMLLSEQGLLGKLIGNYGYAYYPVSGREIDSENRILGNSISDSDATLSSGDKVAVVYDEGVYRYAEYPLNTSSLTEAIAVIKFYPTITGILAAYEDEEKAARESSEKNISSYLEKINDILNDLEAASENNEVTVAGLKEQYDVDDLRVIKSEDYDMESVQAPQNNESIVEYAYSIGTEEARPVEFEKKRYAEMQNVVVHIDAIEGINNLIATQTENQLEIETEFNVAMGSMLRDGYWSDTNYTVGQEDLLYQDALAISQKMAFPIATYSVGVQNLARLSKYSDEEFDIAQTIRMYDPDMKINDHGIVSKIIDHPDAPLSDTLEISTDILDIGNKTFASILERVTEMAERVRQNRELYERAAAISKDGTIHSDILEGAIDVLKTRLLSTVSNWQTDANGNIVMTSLDGTSAMMLCGSGFMCANTKTEDGAWNWRTFGTGDGFTADMIVTGYLNAERIEARSITVDRLSPNVGSELDISTNTAIELVDGKIGLVVSKDSKIDGEDPSKSELVLTENMVTAISNNIKLVANEIDLSANESIELTVSNSIDKAIGDVEESISKLSQTADGIRLEVEKKVDGDTLRTYLRYENGIVEVGKSDSKYTTQTSDSGFTVLYEGEEMTSMVKNTVSSPVIEARRQFKIGNHIIRKGSSGELIFF